MKNPDDNFLIGRLRSLKFALKGTWLLITTEHSVIIQIFIAIIVSVLGFIMQISATEWMFQFLAIGLVLVAESLNTGIEKLSDFVHPAYNKKIGFIKDISAGAATFAAIIAVIIGLIIYIPKFS
ncbi:diacylglycerol kinase [Aureibaculum conchae]|uniref:diacylglycerol kinase n=1 Tax=Aureibaculum sp. 2308TA14-22 TaxID=3108392 RepID=UPI003394386D